MACLILHTRRCFAEAIAKEAESLGLIDGGPLLH